MKEPLLYPERSRCRNCRSYFGFAVFFGLYCSRYCAGLPEPMLPIPFPADEDPALLPRCCRNARFRDSRPKIRFACEQDALDALTERGAFYRGKKTRPQPSAYLCGHCGYWHTGILFEDKLAEAS